MSQTAFQISVLLASAITCGLAADQPAYAQDGERAARIQYLIETLASKNDAPKIQGDARKGDDQTIRFPQSYDKSAQVPVFLAVKELLAEDEAAIDMLLAHTDDKRYSFSINSDTDNNVTVSVACQWIASVKLHCYQPELRMITRSGPVHNDELESLSVWWDKNKRRGLAALQTEAIDAELEFLLGVDGKTALPWHPEANRLPIDEFNRLRDTNIRKLKAIRHYITETSTPYRPTTLDSKHTCMFGLPWTGRRHNN